jgi:hypothetical protein
MRRPEELTFVVRCTFPDTVTDPSRPPWVP